MIESFNHLGIDFGARFAGTTAVTLFKEGHFHVFSSKKKSDADKFLMDLVFSHKPVSIFIDAPLSLPAAFFGSGTNYSHRQCDLELKAMSPMFLGGLTARAIELKERWTNDTIQLFESYPKALVEYFDLMEFYKKDQSLFLSKLNQHFSSFDFPVLDNWHEVDSLLCWLTGYRLSKEEHKTVGDPNEGIIYY